MLLEKMTWEEIAEQISRCTPLILPVGSIEQHGPHLPLATDLYSVLEISKLISDKIDLVIAPPLYYTYTKSMRSFVGTTSIEGNTLTLLIRDLIKEFLRQGFKKILVLNGHYENTAFLEEGTYLALEHCSKNDAKIVLTTWWDLIPEKALKEIFTDAWEGWSGVHASFPETSLAMALNPSIVRRDKILDDKPEENKPYTVLPTPVKRIPKSGIFGKTINSSEIHGERLKYEVLEQLTLLIEKEFND